MKLEGILILRQFGQSDLNELSDKPSIVEMSWKILWNTYASFMCARSLDKHVFRSQL